MRKSINVLAGIGCYLLVTLLFWGYGHIDTHIQLNTVFGLRFLEKVETKTIADLAKFKNYEFNWNNNKQPDLVGPALIKGEYKLSTVGYEEDMTFTPLDWITQGGWMEDEPWGPASLRHFYDPKGIDQGKTHLTDRSSFIEKEYTNFLEWMSVDAKTWTISKNNPYSWLNAKSFVVKALKEPNVQARNYLMAQAYRSLGQTLHLVADMGCPPHVRNDSHPPKFSSIIGDPDPYEDICKVLDAYTLAKANTPNSNLKSMFERTNQFEQIFHLLANYTNGNFFSGGTIYTYKFSPKVRPNNPYTTPYLTDAEYNPSSYTYSKTMDGNVFVKMCKDNSPTSETTKRVEPYLDYECVESMASVIMPNIAEAGANVIRLFIPALKMIITEAKTDSGGIVRGYVDYVVSNFNDEYYNLFYDRGNIYNGTVGLYIDGKNTEIAAQATNNRFEFRLNGKVKSFDKGNKVITKIDFGGIVLKSDEKEITETTEKKIELAIVPNPLQGVAGLISNLAGLTNGLAPKSAQYIWDFGDGSALAIIKNDSTATHTYQKEGEYTIRLKLYDQQEKLVGETSSKAIITAKEHINETKTMTIEFGFNGTYFNYADNSTYSDNGLIKLIAGKTDDPILWSGNQCRWEYSLIDATDNNSETTLKFSASVSEDANFLQSMNIEWSYYYPAADATRSSTIRKAGVSLSNFKLQTPFNYIQSDGTINTVVHSDQMIFEGSPWFGYSLNSINWNSGYTINVKFSK